MAYKLNWSETISAGPNSGAIKNGASPLFHLLSKSKPPIKKYPFEYDQTRAFNIDNRKYCALDRRSRHKNLSNMQNP